MAKRRSIHQIIEMKEKLIKKCLNKKIKWKEAAELLNMHPKALSRLKRRYLEHGKCALIGKKPSPKNGWAYNRTSESIERIVETVAIKNPHLGPQPLSDELRDNYHISLNGSTIWRILKRRKVRYTHTYKRWKQEPKLYALDIVGEEMQMDGCYPYGRARKLMSFDAIDDCSRYAYGKCYDRETTENAILFVTELVSKVPFRIQRIRVDNRYGKRFKEYCEKELGIEVIENDAYSPEQNGKIERFHGTLKKEFFNRYCSYYDDMETINYKYTLWLHTYNYERRHTGLKMNKLTPVQKITTTYLHTFANIFVENQKVTGTLQQNMI